MKTKLLIPGTKFTTHLLILPQNSRDCDRHLFSTRSQADG